MNKILDGLAKLVSPSEQKKLVHGGDRIQPAMAGKPLPVRDWDFASAVQDGYKRSVLVYRAIFSFALSISALVPVVEVRRGSEWEPAEEGDATDELGRAGAELQRLLLNPTRDGTFSGVDLLETTTLHLLLAGNAFAHLTPASGGPRYAGVGATQPPILEIEPMIPKGISPVIDSQGRLDHYDFRFGAVRRTYKREEIIHTMLRDPENMFWGMSPLQAAAESVETDTSAISWNRFGMDNRAAPDLWFIYKDWLTDSQYQEAREMIADLQGPAGAHQPGITGGEWDVKLLGRSPQEMDWVDSRRFIREEVLSAFAIPPVVAGYFDNATLANAEVSRRLWWDDAVIPLANRIAASFATRLAPHFATRDVIRIWFDPSTVDALKENIESKAKTLKALQEAGVPYNEAIKMLELSLAPNELAGDEPFGVLNLFAQRPAPISIASNGGGGGESASTSGPTEAKANEPTEEELSREQRETGEILNEADKVKPAIRRAFDREVARLAPRRRDLEEAIRNGNLERLAEILPVEKLAAQFGTSLADAIESAFAAAAVLATGHLAELAGRDLPSLDRDVARSWATDRAFDSTALVGDSTKRGVEELARRIGAGELVGDAAALAALALGHWALNANDARSLQTSWAKMTERGLSEAERTRVVGRIADAKLVDRAEAIAEFEAVASVNNGRTVVWGHLRDEFATMIRMWVHSQDRRVCDECLPMIGIESSVEDPYVHPISGRTYAAPGPDYVHNKCRCGEFISELVS